MQLLYGGQNFGDVFWRGGAEVDYIRSQPGRMGLRTPCELSLTLYLGPYEVWIGVRW